jgi:hypothetical protein
VGRVHKKIIQVHIVREIIDTRIWRKQIPKRLALAKRLRNALTTSIAVPVDEAYTTRAACSRSTSRPNRTEIHRAAPGLLPDRQGWVRPPSQPTPVRQSRHGGGRRLPVPRQELKLCTASYGTSAKISVFFSIFCAFFDWRELFAMGRSRPHQQRRIPPESIDWRIFLLLPLSCSQSRKR